MSRVKRAGVFGFVTLIVACTTITEDLPEEPTPNPVAPVPVVVVPIAVPTPQPAPAPPAPNPNPAPNPAPPAPAPPPGGGPNMNPVAGVTAGVHSYLRGGKLIPSSATAFKVGDVAYLNCTPRDADGKPTDNHGPIQAWYISGSAAYRVTDTDTFNPDLHCQGPGNVNIACKVNNITSPTKKLTIE